MKNNLIQFPTSYKVSAQRAKTLEQTDELKALRAAFNRATAGWPLEDAELPENNKIYGSLKK